MPSSLHWRPCLLPTIGGGVHQEGPGVSEEEGVKESCKRSIVGVEGVGCRGGWEGEDPSCPADGSRPTPLQRTMLSHCCVMKPHKY